MVSHQQEQVLDPKTRLMLYKLVNGEILEAVNGCISTGKEACVFHAHGGRFVQLQINKLIVHYQDASLRCAQYPGGTPVFSFFHV